MPYRPIIYIESVSKDPRGSLTLLQVENALGHNAENYDLVIADADAPDLECLRDAEYFVSARFDTERLRLHAPALRLVHFLSAGVERYIPFDWLPAGAILTNSSGVHSDMVGEYATMALLMLNHHMHRYIEFQKKRRWAQIHASPIRGKTVLVVGTGNLGSAIAVQARRLGTQVIGISRQGQPCEAFDRVESIAMLDLILPIADFIILACPLTTATRHMFDRKRFSYCRRGAGLINVGRGALVNTDALMEALYTELLAGAILDVQELEPVPVDSPWWDAKHLILTPHISCDIGDGYFDRGLAIFSENLLRIRDGMPLHNVVNLQEGY